MQKYVIALYIRLSIEDYKYDSLSIENQSLVLHEYAASMPEALNAEIMEFIDNGYSGTNFERPQVQKLIELVRANQIDCIIVKDFSRFGRNSIETGYFTIFYHICARVSGIQCIDRHQYPAAQCKQIAHQMSGRQLVQEEKRDSSHKHGREQDISALRPPA